jgi:hypothetical protein
LNLFTGGFDNANHRRMSPPVRRVYAQRIVATISGNAAFRVKWITDLGRFTEGEEQKELVSLIVEKVGVDPVGRNCYIRKFPAPSCLGTGNLLRVVAGAGFEPATFGL